MGAEFEQKKRNVINALNGVLRTGALKEQDIGQQRLVLLVDQLLERSGASGRLPLGPVYEYLKERQLEDDAIVETLLVFKEREGALDITLELPAALEQLPSDRRQRLLLRYQKRQRSPRTKVSAPASEPHVPAPSAPKARLSVGSARQKLLLVTLLLVLAGGGGVLLWLEQTAPAGPVTVVIDDPNGLPCKELKGTQPVLLCWVEKGEYEKLGPSERKTRALATKAAGAGLGYQKLQVWTLEDQRLREVH